MKNLRKPLSFRQVLLLVNAGLLMLLQAQAALTAPEDAGPPTNRFGNIPRAKAYSESASCNDCHLNASREHADSMHSRSFSNPVFLAQYQQDVLPTAQSSADGFRQARSCTACHAPVAQQLARARVVVPDPALAASSGVTCDFCHTIAGYYGAVAGNGNYRSEPGDTKFGPLQTKTDWHHQYSPLQTRSEFCGICHSVRNQLGLDVKSTYAEWQASRQAKEGIQCQDCHMSVNGFLTEGRAVHASGVAAAMNLGTAPMRNTLYTHRFQGARTHSQIEGAIRLAFQTPAAPAKPGSPLNLVLLVDNSRTGHKMPSGSVELRYLWLDVFADVDGQRVPLLPSAQPARDGYDLTGAHAEIDRPFLASAVPPGRRIYRTLLADPQGRPTLAFFQAQRILFDNRLNASEVRPESYRLTIPKTAASRVVLSAHLYYVAYPEAFAQRLGLAKATPVEIASATTEIALAKQMAARPPLPAPAVRAAWPALSR